MWKFKKKEVCMTTIAKRQNGNLPSTFGNVVDNIFQNELRRLFDDNIWNGRGLAGTGVAPVNVRENQHQYQVDVIAPGCRKEDFNVVVKDNMLTVSFERKQENAETDENKGWVRNEFIQQSFTRSFSLDETVDVDKISGDYTDGILRINLPKNEKSRQQSRQIEIN
jgi:HSP20 family protein